MNDLSAVKIIRPRNSRLPHLASTYPPSSLSDVRPRAKRRKRMRRAPAQSQRRQKREEAERRKSVSRDDAEFDARLGKRRCARRWWSWRRHGAGRIFGPRRTETVMIESIHVQRFGNSGRQRDQFHRRPWRAWRPHRLADGRG